MRILKKFPALCDFCAAAKPTFVYDMPVGTPLWVEANTGRVVLSTGWVGACPRCRATVDEAGGAAAALLAVRFVDAHPEILANPANPRDEVVRWRARLNALLFKKITNLSSPRAYVPFEDPLEGKFVEIE